MTVWIPIGSAANKRAISQKLVPRYMAQGAAHKKDASFPRRALGPASSISLRLVLEPFNFEML